MRNPFPIRFRFLGLFFLLAFAMNSYGQLTSFFPDLSDTLSRRYPLEKLYLHTDKPYYLEGDTMYLKAYLLNSTLSYYDQSGIVYVELISDSTLSVIKRIALASESGISYGQLVLDEEVKNGSYILRAYTNWMQNFGSASFFSRKIEVVGVEEHPWLVSRALKQEGNEVKVALNFRTPEKQLGLRELDIQVLHGKKVLSRDNTLQTTSEGRLEFPLPAEGKAAEGLTIIARDLRKGEGNRKLVIPVSLHRPEYTDLQFMPEGGNLVAGLPSRIGFKAIGEDGLGTDVTGSITDDTHTQITTFSSEHRGMGSFYLIPQPGRSYTAQLTLPNGNTKSYALPEVKASGISMQVRQQDDSVAIALMCTADLNPGTCILAGQSQGKVHYAARVQLDSSGVRIKAAKSLFPTGIARFSLYKEEDTRQVLTERMVFINHNDELQISITPHQESYTTRDSISLAIEVRDKAGKPIEGSFSLSVTDDSSVQPDSSISTIRSHMLLSTELKGYIEDPNHYFRINANPRDLDHLLLTQGWVNHYQNLSLTGTPVYAAEPEFTVKGKVSNAFNKSIANANIVLLSNNPSFFLDTMTNQRGRFEFRNIPAFDTVKFVIQARNRNNKSFNVGVEVEEFKPAAITKDIQSLTLTPWYVNTDTTLLKSLKEKQQNVKGLQVAGNLMREVVITAKKIVPGSKNLNGPGQADLILDRGDMEKAGKKTLLQLIEEKVKGFHIGGWPTPMSPPMYRIADRQVRLTIDGIDVEQFYQPDGTRHL